MTVHTPPPTLLTVLPSPPRILSVLTAVPARDSPPVPMRCPVHRGTDGQEVGVTSSKKREELGLGVDSGTPGLENDPERGRVEESRGKDGLREERERRVTGGPELSVTRRTLGGLVGQMSSGVDSTRGSLRRGRRCRAHGDRPGGHTTTGTNRGCVVPCPRMPP